MASVKELLERVKDAAGPDRGLDGLIAIAFPPDGEARTELGEATSRYGKYWFKHEHGEGSALPRLYTASIDAALALTERLLPGWSYQVSKSHGEHDPFFVARVAKALGDDVTGFDGISDHSAPLAILAALLSSLSKEGNEP